MTRPPAPALSDAEAATVARFDASPVPPEVVVENVARELANHQGLRGPMDDERPDVWQNRCDCGWDDGDDRPGWRERYRLHVAAAAIAAMPPSPAEAAVLVEGDWIVPSRELHARDLTKSWADAAQNAGCPASFVARMRTFADVHDRNYRAALAPQADR